MSVAAASSAVGTQQPTQEQIRLAQLIEDKKHDQPEVQEIVRKVLDVVTNSNQEDALLALFDCDYDYEKAVALLIEKGHDVASEWRTATNHKITKKQQKTALTKNGHGEEPDENGHQRGNDGYSYRGKSRGGRSRNQQQQSNGGDSQHNNNNNQQQQQQQQNDHYVPQQRQRGESGYRGRYRASNRGGQRTNDRNYQQQQQYEQQPQDSNVDASLPSDTTQRSADVQYSNRRGEGRQQQQQWDVGNWNGETVIYSRSAKDDEQDLDSANNNVSNTSHAAPGVPNGQSSSLGVSTVNNTSELTTQQKLKADFDPVEAARQIKNVIGIGQLQQQQHNARTPKPLMDLKPLMSDQQAGQQQQKSNVTPSKSFGQNLNTKVTPPPPQRIPHQPVIFSDRFDGGMNKIDVQFGNLGETSEDASSKNVQIPISSSSAFYHHAESIPPMAKQNSASSSVQNLQRTAAVSQHQPSEQSSFVSSNTHTNLTRPSEQQQQQQQQQQSVINLQRALPPQMQQQQPSMTMKPVVPPQYAVHHQQHQMSAPNLLLQSLLYQHQQQQEPVSLDATYDPTAFQIPPVDFSAQYFMAAPMNPQQPTQPRYLVSQPPLPGQQQQQQQHQQASSNRQQSSSNVQTSSLSTSSSSSVPSLSTVNASTTAPKKGPAVPPGMFLSAVPPAQPPYSGTYSTAYGVPPQVGGQQQTGASAYSTPYDTEHLFTNSFMQLTNPQQAQSPSGAYGSVTPPVQQQNQQQQQQAHTNNDNKTISYRTPITENMLLLQQYQQYAIQQSNNQQQGQQGAAHSSAPLSYFVGHPASAAAYSPGPQIMYAQPPAPLAHQQQQAPKQHGQHYNQNNSSSGMSGTDDYYGRGSSSSSSNKEAPYMYAVPAQAQQVPPPPQSVGQQQGLNKQQQAQQQQRASNNVYNNQQNQQRPFQ